MQLVNGTKFQAAYNQGLKPDGRELLVVVVKGTFSLPKFERDALVPAEVQAELVMSDEFSGEPGFSAPIYECDFMPFKPACDVLFNGSAYAPNYQPARRVEVSLRVSTMKKSFAVIGDRAWIKAPLGMMASNPEPFLQMPISYDNAFGGVDKLHPEEKKHRFYLTNHGGRGFYDTAPNNLIEGKPLPNTEELNHSVISPSGKYKPMAFGAVGRAWQPRPKFAGTYDQNWLDNIFPFLPPDFDERYYQSAPADQWIDYPGGGEEVELTNLTLAGKLRFELPALDMPVRFYYRDGKKVDHEAVVDTLIIEPDLERLVVVWRTALELKKNIFEVSQVVAGRMPPGWYRAREQGKQYYGSLQELVAARREDRE